MPIDPAGGALLDAGQGVQNFMLTDMQNTQSRRFSEKMYGRQYDDNIKFWQMQNEYNSPQNQMKRFQEAGLNPHLIYGQGNSGPAGPIKSPDVQSGQFRVPDSGPGPMNAINTMYDLEIKQATLDNLKSQNTVIQNEAALKAAQIPLTATNAERARFNLDFESELRPISADARREQLRQTKTSTDLAINRDAREAAMNASSIQEAAERMLTMQQQRTVIPYQKRQMTAQTAASYESIRQMIKDGTLKDLDIELRRMHINPNDPMWARVVGGILSNIVENPTSLLNAADGIKKYIPTVGNIWSRFYSGQ